MLDQIIDERARNSVFGMSVKTISMFSENYLNSRGIARTDFSSGQKLIKPLVFYLALPQ